MEDNKKLIITIAGVIVLGLVIFYLVTSKSTLQNTMIGGNSQTSSWKNYFDSKTGISFQYPETLNTTYIDPIDWPPKIQIVNGPFSCTEAGSENERAGKTEKITIHGTTYCVTKFTEGAAGSIYTLYAYGFEREEKVVIFSFGLRKVQCANYQEPQKTACQNEQTSFDIDAIVDAMAKTMVK